MSRAEREERISYAKRGKRSVTVPKAGDPEEIAYRKRATTGGNGAPRYDPDAPPTLPYLMRDIGAFRMQDGTEITSRSKLREYNKRNQVEDCGHDWTASSDVGKPHWYDVYADHRKDKAKRAKQGKDTPAFKPPPKAQKKVEKTVVHTHGAYDAKTMKRIA